MNLLELGDRYAELRESKNLSIAQLSKEIKCNAKTISFYENGSRGMPSNVILKYSEFFNVSSDYLLGLSDVKTKNTDIVAIHDVIGLSDKAICLLMTEKIIGNDKKIKLLNFLCEQELDEFLTAIKAKQKYAKSGKTEYFDTEECNNTIKIDVETTFKVYSETLFWQLVEKYYNDTEG